MAEDVVTIVKKAPNTTTMIKSFGSLSLLPREIRDEIYRHSLPKEYYWEINLDSASLYDSSDLISYDPFGNLGLKLERIRTDLPIFCLSKAIKEEAMAWLYLNGRFLFRCNLIETQDQVLHRPRTDTMTNVAIFCNAALDPRMDSAREYCVTEFRTSVFYGGLRAGPLDFFRGDTIARNFIFVVLDLGEWWRHSTNLTVSPLFEALKQLTGFETAILMLVATDKSYWRKPIDKGWEGLYTNFGSLLEDVSMSLEPTLGKSKTLPEEIGPTLGYPRIQKAGFQVSRSREVVFHPRNHQAAISKAKKEISWHSHNCTRAPSDLTT